MAETPLSTPKRKHSQMLNDGLLRLNTTTQFTFDANTSLDDDNASPRSRVAHRFRGLALGGGGGGSGPSAGQSTMDTSGDDDGSRKRVKLPDIEMRDADGIAVFDDTMSTTRNAAQTHPEPTAKRPRPSPRTIHFALDDAVVEQSETSFVGDDDDTTPSATPPSPPPTQPAARPQQPRNQATTNNRTKRAGTPPFPSTTKSTGTITDPLRASLTWHEDEITIYDPDDSDDDGTGINGIGFKPTPAIAHSRALRRRQQLAEYKKREEREARAKRSLRRRGASPAPAAAAVLGGIKKKEERRRVRFLEAKGVREGRKGKVIEV
ncbi:hypothetical protein VTI74DRAFT_9074 [Chaetomium olivicolor]